MSASFKTFVLASTAACCIAANACAAPDLIALGSLDSHGADLSAETAGTLENGLAGNRLGGIGSGFAYAGDNTYIAIPDRGPNAVPYNPRVDDTTSYIDRFQTLTLAFTPNPPGAALPYRVTPTLVGTTLLSSATPLVYGSGTAAGLVNGAPALNARHRTYYFTGRSDNFDPRVPSDSPANGRLDPEGVRVSNDGKSVYIADEYGPDIYRFDRATGRRVRSYVLPRNLAVAHPSAMGRRETASNAQGRAGNQGIEGLAITPDGRMLVGILQSHLIQDSRRSVRIVTIDIETGAAHEYAYRLSSASASVSDIVAVNSHRFLVDERDGKGLGNHDAATFKKLFLIDLRGARDVTAMRGNLAAYAVPKTGFLDIVGVLRAHGIDPRDIPAKLEGLAFGPDLVVDGATRHTLIVTSDNDFLPTVPAAGHPEGVPNPTRFYVFGFDDADLPGFQPQRIATPGNGMTTTTPSRR